MYVVAFVFESRTPSFTKFDENHTPVWRKQSKAFLPGDFGLALFIAAATPKWPTSYWSVAVGLLVCVAAFVGLRFVTYKPSDYTKSAWNSPSKRYHDYVISSVFAFTAVTWWWPINLLQESTSQWQIMAAAVGFAVWLAGLAIDGVFKQVPNKYQHPSVYSARWH